MSKKVVGGLVVLILLTILLNNILAEDSLIMKINQPLTFCDCDEQCEGDDGCLTFETNDYLLDLNTKSDDYIEEANDEGFKGVCAKLLIGQEQVVKTMTDDCTGLIKEENTENTEENEEPTIEIDEEEIINILNSINFDEENNENNEDAIETKETNSNEYKENNEKTDNNLNDYKNKNETGGGNMTMEPSIIIAITITIVSFFALIGWMAYLLQKRR